MRYHLRWKHRDLDGVMALYHPDVQYSDFSRIGCSAWPSCVNTCAAACRGSGEALEHCDRIRVDGNTAFIQYRITLRGGDGLVSFRPARRSRSRTG
jgi:ketosteroid isomerase-like protein